MDSRRACEPAPSCGDELSRSSRSATTSAIEQIAMGLVALDQGPAPALRAVISAFDMVTRVEVTGRTAVVTSQLSPAA